MARRKGRRSFGSLRQLPSGRWQARYRDPTGRLHTAPQTFAARPEAARFLAQVQTDLARGEWTDPRAGRVAFEEWAARWQETTTNLRPNTKALHIYLLRRFLLPAFGSTALADIDLMAVRTWLAGLEAAPVSPNTVAKAYRLLARIMDTAVEAGVLLRNPCSVKGAATERAAEMRVATVAQVAALAEAIQPRYRTLVLVAAYAGLRWGELVGLRVKRVDLLHGRIAVAEQATGDSRALHLGPAEDGGRQAHRDPAGGRGHRPGRTLGHLQRARPGWAGVPVPRGRAAATKQLRSSGVAAGHPGGWRGGASLPRSAAHVGHAVDRGGREHPGADGPVGALLLGRRPALPARDGRPGRGDRGRAG
jgi:integrase